MNSHESTKRATGPQIKRRTFLKSTSALAAATALGAGLVKTGTLQAAEFTGAGPDLTELSSDVGLRHSICQMCHGRCGVRVMVKDGVALKIDGNPYNPTNLPDDQRIPYETSPSDPLARKTRGRVCAKAQAGLEALYNPFRIRQPLKRVGPRGSNQWQTVTWDAALTDIANRMQPLLSNDPIDPAFPELGPKRNLVVFAPGRLPAGQNGFTDRFFGKGIGTINSRHDHTSICETSHHVAYNLSLGQNDLKPDFANCEYILYFGTNPLGANFSFVTHAFKLTRFRARGGQMVVVDPYFSVTASKANRWVPIKPGTDAAFALGMIRWIIENNRHNTAFLRPANQASANAANEKSWTDATHLVIVQDGHANKGKLLTAAEAGIATPAAAGNRVCLVTGVATEIKESATAADAVTGDLDVSTTVNGIAVKSVFRMLRDRSSEKTLAEWAAIAGVEETAISTAASEFTSHGVKAMADCYRGPVQHTNGTYAAWAILHLNTLIGNIDHKGGATKGGSTYNELDGSGKGISLATVPGGVTSRGIQLTRVKSKYDTATAPKLIERDGPVPPRPWFPFALNGNFQEVLAAIDANYPYGSNAQFALFLYWNVWTYSTPGLREVGERVMRDETKIPLLVSIDVDFGESTVFADYILPDATYLENWAAPHFSPAEGTYRAPFRQPVVGKAREAGSNAWHDVGSPDFQWDVSKDWEYQPLFECKTVFDIFIELGKKLNGGQSVPGIGAGAFSAGLPYTQCDRAWHWVRNMLYNLEKASGKSAQEISDKGGAFEAPASAYSGEFTKGQVKARIKLYVDSVATTADTIGGGKFDGLPRYQPIVDFKGRPIDDSAQFPFQIVTYKLATHGQARTMAQAHLLEADPDNYIEIAASDATRLGISTGDLLRLTSASSATGVLGRALVTQRLRPGVLAVSHHMGHWHMSGLPVSVDSSPRTVTDDTRVDTRGAPRSSAPERLAGLTINPIMRLDPSAGNVCLTDKIGGSASFFDTWVQVQKI